MNEQKLNIYPNRDKSYERELKQLEKASIRPKNKELITKFHNYLFSTGSGILRVSKLSSQLRHICAKLDKNLDQLTKEDLVVLIAIYNKDIHYSEATKADYRRTLKQFFRWFKDEDSRLEASDEEVRFETKKFYKFLEHEIKMAYKRAQADPKTIISDEDCLAVLEKGCRTHREKAFISMLHESGGRAGEFLNIRIGDVEVKESYAEVNLDGKTGKRTIFIVKSLPYLLRYLDTHPYNENKQSCLWLSEANHNCSEPLLHKGAQKLIDRCFDRVDTKKKHNLHWFRHSRATILSPKMTESMLCKYMGWTIGSKQIRTYCHLSVKQLEDVVLAIHGIKLNEDVDEKPARCICGALNCSTERYCFKCCKPLKIETVIQDKELVNSEINKTVRFMMEMSKNPDMMKAFDEFKKKQDKKINKLKLEVQE